MMPRRFLFADYPHLPQTCPGSRIVYLPSSPCSPRSPSPCRTLPRGRTRTGTSPGTTAAHSTRAAAAVPAETTPARCPSSARSATATPSATAPATQTAARTTSRTARASTTSSTSPPPPSGLPLRSSSLRMDGGANVQRETKGTRRIPSASMRVSFTARGTLSRRTAIPGEQACKLKGCIGLFTLPVIVVRTPASDVCFAVIGLGGWNINRM